MLATISASGDLVTVLVIVVIVAVILWIIRALR